MKRQGIFDSRSEGPVAVRAVKGVVFHYSQTERTRELLETFRQMVNHAVDICSCEGINGRLNLRNRIHSEFQERYPARQGPS